MRASPISFGLMGLLLASGAYATTPAVAPVYMDPVYGYSFQLPKFAGGEGQPAVQRVIVFAPAENQFAANINVMVQNTDMSPQDFWAVSAQQFTAAKLTIIAHSDTKVAGKPGLLIEYKGQMQGQELHFLALAVFVPKHVILVTCTALESSYKDHEADFKSALDSFHI